MWPLKASKNFYNQTPVSLKEADGTVRGSKWNLLFIWDFDKAFNVSKVWLVFPTRAGSKPADVRYSIYEEIKHPATHTPFQEPTPVEPGTDEELRRLLQVANDGPEEQKEKSNSATTGA